VAVSGLWVANVNGRFERVIPAAPDPAETPEVDRTTRAVVSVLCDYKAGDMVRYQMRNGSVHIGEVIPLVRVSSKAMKLLTPDRIAVRRVFQDGRVAKTGWILNRTQILGPMGAEEVSA
jgi:hypothetical protein